jgi:diaminohydroxyphosphoribosylaminopyrimidine deaminase/5-amino-6-(5-phosphoribosylamino)uracil reductase
MREAGLVVEQGILEAECRRTHDDFLRHIVSGRCFVTVKSAVSLDGKIALPNGESKWITGDLARQRAHLLRHEHDVVLTGIGTVLADDPQLSVRLEGKWKQPARLVLDSQARLPLDARIWTEAPQLFVAVGEKAPRARVEALEERGATVLTVPDASGGGLSFEALLMQLYDRRLFSVLVEAGARVAGSVLSSGMVDKVVFFIAPMLIGEGLPAIQGIELSSLTDAPRLRDTVVEQVGADVMVSGYLTD